MGPETLELLEKLFYSISRLFFTQSQNLVIVYWFLKEVKTIQYPLILVVLIIFVFFRANNSISKKFQVYYKRMNTSITQYLSVFNFVFSTRNLESIRFCGFTELFEKRLLKAREHVSSCIKSELYRNIVSSVLNRPMASYVVIFGLMASKLMLSPERTIPADFIFFLIKTTEIFMTNLKDGVFLAGYLFQQIKIVGQIQGFLSLDESPSQYLFSNGSSQVPWSSFSGESSEPSHPEVESAAHSTSETPVQMISFANSILKFEANKCTSLSGPMGSGKTVLLKSLLGEQMLSQRVGVKTRPNRFLVVSQERICLNRTIRENITLISEKKRNFE